MKEHYHHGNLKNELIETSIRIISESGFDALSLRRVSALCGVSHNAVYRHFADKAQLIEACRDYVTQRLTEQLSGALAEAGSDADAVRRLSRTYLAFYAAHPTYFSALYRNTSAKLIFSLEELPENYPPLELFRRAVCARGAGAGWSREETLTRLIRLWSLLHGLTTLVISPNAELGNSWQSCVDNILEQELFQ